MTPLPLVLPSRIAWDLLKAKDLEECVYWLLDSMGAKDLEWRVGGRGQGSPDGGRDLVASFYASDPDEELRRQLWWLEVKGRAATVEASAVKEAIINASGVGEVDVIVIVTNSVFSNPTRDWVREWQREHHRPTVRLWDGSTLERMVSKHPSVAVRLFPEALSDQGQLEVAREQFWSSGFVTGRVQLSRLWKTRASVVISAETLLALVASEVALGSSGERNWAVLADVDTVSSAIATGIANALYLLQRAERLGGSFDHFVGAMSELLLVLLSRESPSAIASMINAVWDADTRFFDAPPSVRNVAVTAWIDGLEAMLHDVCTFGCSRMLSARQRLSLDEIGNFWDRLKSPADEKDTPVTSTRSLRVELTTEPCNIGLPLSKDVNCPLSLDREVDLNERLSYLKLVVSARNPHSKSTSVD